MDKIFYVDYDATLIDFESIWLKQMSESSGHPVELIKSEPAGLLRKELTGKIREGKFDKYTDSFFEELYQNVEFFDGAIDFLKTLKENGYKIVIVTSSMSGAQKKNKMIHIENNVGNLVDKIIPARKKHPHTTNGFFMDDNLKHVIGHIDNNSDQTGILFNFGKAMSYNKETLDTMFNHSRFEYLDNFEDVLSIMGIKSSKKNTKEKKKNKTIQI